MLFRWFYWFQCFYFKKNKNKNKKILVPVLLLEWFYWYQWFFWFHWIYLFHWVLLTGYSGSTGSSGTIATVWNSINHYTGPSDLCLSKFSPNRSEGRQWLGNVRFSVTRPLSWLHSLSQFPTLNKISELPRLRGTIQQIIRHAGPCDLCLSKFSPNRSEGRQWLGNVRFSVTRPLFWLHSLSLFQL